MGKPTNRQRREGRDPDKVRETTYDSVCGVLTAWEKEHPDVSPMELAGTLLLASFNLMASQPPSKEASFFSRVSDILAHALIRHVSSVATMEAKMIEMPPAANEEQPRKPYQH